MYLLFIQTSFGTTFAFFSGLSKMLQVKKYVLKSYNFVTIGTVIKIYKGTKWIFTIKKSIIILKPIIYIKASIKSRVRNIQ